MILNILGRYLIDLGSTRQIILVQSSEEKEMPHETGPRVANSARRSSESHIQSVGGCTRSRSVLGFIVLISLIF